MALGPSAHARRPRASSLVALALLGLAVLATSCAKTVREFNLIDTKQELQLGADFAAEVDSTMVMIPDAQIVAYVDSLGQVLARNSRRNDIPYHIKVVDTDEVNAFALPGGYLYVNRGLIEHAENECELAGVMGHEIGHVVGRHGAKQLSRQYGLSFLAGLVLGQNPGFWHEQAVGLFATGTLLHYGREAELEADQLGAEEVYRSGLDPQGLPTFFEKLLALHEREPSGLEKLFSTHPPTTERIAAVKAYIATLPPHGTPTRDSARFHAVQDRLKAMPPPKSGTS